AGLARAGDGLRHGRLLQLRRAGAPARWHRTLRALVPRRPRLCRQHARVGRAGFGARMTTSRHIPGAGAPQQLDLSAPLGWQTFRTPLMAASGCFGYGLEYARALDLASLGAVVVKGLFLEPREGHAPPRIVETPGGMLNAIGLQGIGVHRFVRERLPELRGLGATTIVNVCGVTLDEYVEVSRVLSDHEGVAAIELNISCPNIKEGGIQFGCSLPGTHDVVAAVKRA